MDEYSSGAYPLVLHADADPNRLGGIAICGFSTVGSVGVIATSHLIQTLELSPMGTVMHPKFPAIALIHDSVPKHPVRVYQGDGIGVFTAEIQFPSENDVYFGETIMEWFTKGGFDRLIIIDGVVSNDLGIQVIAEGVETRAELDVLAGLGCTLFQGFFFARPGFPLPDPDWPT